MSYLRAMGSLLRPARGREYHARRSIDPNFITACHSFSPLPPQPVTIRDSLLPTLLAPFIGAGR